MKRIILVTHGTLCEGFLSSLEIICGAPQGIETVSLGAEDTIASLSEKVKQRIDRIDPQEAVYLLTDIAIGTTTKCVFPLLERKNLYCVSGINLALLLSIYLTDLGEQPFDQLKRLTEESKTTMLFINDQINGMES